MGLSIVYILDNQYLFVIIFLSNGLILLLHHDHLYEIMIASPLD